MKILEISFGKFPDISFLNPNFKPRSTKIRVVLDIILPRKRKAQLDSVYSQIHKLLPTLSKHRCCLGLSYGTLNQEQEGDISLKSMEDATDIAHMMEHMIIDLQANICGMDTCSGITCGYREPDFRFDIFVECKDKSVGRFCSYLTLSVIKAAIAGKRLFPGYQRLISLAKYLYQYPQRAEDYETISKDLNLSVRSMRSLFQELVSLKYFSKG